jgi:hypothetical protein
MQIVGITGGIGHGKTTFGADLAAHATSAKHFESSDVIIEVANAWRAARGSLPPSSKINDINAWLQTLPEAITQITHVKTDAETLELTFERLVDHPEYYTKLFQYLDELRAEPDMQTGVIDISNKQAHRALLQWLGGYLAKVIDEGLWFDELIRRIRQLSNVALVTVGGVRFPADADRIHAVGGVIIEVQRPTVSQADIQDVTERERQDIKADVLIINDSDLEALKRAAAHFYDDLVAGSLQPRYTASEA